MCELVHRHGSLEITTLHVGLADLARADCELTFQSASQDMEDMMDFAGLGKPLTQKALDDAGGIVNIPTAAMWAVIHVESAGAGFLDDRRPKSSLNATFSIGPRAAASTRVTPISRIPGPAATALVEHISIYDWRKHSR